MMEKNLREVVLVLVLEDTQQGDAKKKNDVRDVNRVRRKKDWSFPPTYK